MSLRFHWMLPKGGEVSIKMAREVVEFRTKCYDADSPAALPDMEGWSQFASSAEAAGIESVLISCGPYEPDALLVANALGLIAKKLKFIVAYRSGWMQPTIFVQQFNTLSTLTEGRVALNMVAGSSTKEQHSYGDFLSHDERYSRAEEFLSVCNSFWQDKSQNVDFDGKHYRLEGGRLHTPFLSRHRKTPEVYVSGHSDSARQLARSQCSCWVRVVDTPESLQPLVTDAREHGLEMCLRLGLVCRETRDQAIQAVEALLPDDYKGKRQAPIRTKDDSQMYREVKDTEYASNWLNRIIWTGLVPYYGPIWTFLVGTPEEIAQAFIEYKKIGITQFIISGCPELDEISIFSQKILPLVRQAEQLGEYQ